MGTWWILNTKLWVLRIKVFNKSFIKFSKGHDSLFTYFGIKFCYSLSWFKFCMTYHKDDSHANDLQMDFYIDSSDHEQHTSIFGLI